VRAIFGSCRVSQRHYSSSCVYVSSSDLLYVRGRADDDDGNDCDGPDNFDVPPHVYENHGGSTVLSSSSSRTYFFSYQLFSSVYGVLGTASVYFVVSHNSHGCYNPDSNNGPHGYLVSAEDFTTFTPSGKSLISPLGIGLIVVGIVSAILITVVAYRVSAHWRMQKFKTQSVGTGHSIPVIPEEHRGSISLNRGLVKGNPRPKHANNHRSRITLPANPVLTHLAPPRSPSFDDSMSPASPSQGHSKGGIVHSHSYGEGFVHTEGLEVGTDGKQLADLAVSIVNGGRKSRRNQHVRVHSREFETPFGPRKVVQSIELETPSGSHHVRVRSRELPASFLMSPELQQSRSRNNSGSGPSSPSTNGPATPSVRVPASPSRGPSPISSADPKEIPESEIEAAMKLVVGDQ